MTLGDIVARRRKCATTTRGEMLCAARRRFLEESYENVGLRDIARDVGVDVALVGRYFGNKEELFREVLQGGNGDKFNVAIPAHALPAYLVALIEKDEGADRQHVEDLLIILRSASSPAASEIVRGAVRSDVLEPLAAILEGPHAAIRASLILAILLGATVLRTVMALEPLCDGKPDVVREKLLRLFEAALSDD